MPQLLTIFCLLLTSAASTPVLSKSPNDNIGLPPGALVLESKAIPPTARQNRKIILWMVDYEKHPRESNELYTCPDETRGSYYSGKLSVSLIDTRNGSSKVINTVRVILSDEDENFELPYKIRGGMYYQVNGVTGNAEAKPTIIALKDYNGDGQALEFALFDKQACVGAQTSLFGYSVKQDKVIQYAIKLSTKEATSKGRVETYHWVDNLFCQKPKRPGFWSYSVDYRGRGGALDSYVIHYDKAREEFSGSRSSSPGP